MDPRRLVRPLDDAWRGVLSSVLGVPDAFEPKRVAALAPRLEELSRAYNLGVAEGRRTPLPLEARVAFSFPRDVPKGAGAVRELVAAGALAPRGRPLRVLDLGAGLGAMSWGLSRALGDAPLEALLVDEDAAVLRAAEAIARAARAAGLSGPEIATRAAPLARLGELGGAPWDVVVLGQVLSELDIHVGAAERVEAHAALLGHALDLVADDGAVVVVEPALRARARHLHEVRDRVLAARPGAGVFAPCLHRAPCPMLAVEGEWCHEDLAVDLPAWVAPLARAAGLRWQGLTFAFLVLRKDGRSVGRGLPGEVHLRVVSDRLRSKGKVEVFACTAEGERRRLRRLDRDRDAERGVPFDQLRRGDVVGLGAPDGGSPVDERGRVAAGVHATIDVAAADR